MGYSREAVKYFEIAESISLVPLQKISESARKSTDNEQKLKYSKRCVNIIELFQIID